MKNKSLIYGISGVVIGILLGISALTYFGSASFSQKKAASDKQSPQDTFDAHFIEQMIPHHEDAITMAQLALRKTQKPEIRNLAEAIMKAQQEEIDEMKGWYKDWYGRELPTGTEVMQEHGMMSNNGMHMGMRGDESDIAMLENATDFDRLFIEQMIPHHQMAVMMASMLKNGTQRPEMLQLADDIIVAQTNEIEQMRSWHREWYK